jgi:hypothetical protein
MRLLKVFGLVATLATAVAAAGAARADDGPSWDPESPNFNLEVVLRPGTDDDGFGLVKFRQPNDGSKIIYLDTWVRDLAPNTTYYLRRAVDTTPDDNCTGSNWLTLGPITTDDRGTGRAAHSRNVTGIPSGMEFDIHFIITETPTSTVGVLASGCYQFTVDGD